MGDKDDKISELIKYSNLIMDNYGESIIEKDNVEGYKVSENVGVIVNVNKFINNDEINNKIEYNNVYLTEIKNGMIVKNIEGKYLYDWKDIKLNDGFIREKKNKDDLSEYLKSKKREQENNIDDD